MLTDSVLSKVVNVSRLEGDDNPVQLIYFVENQDGERLSAVKSSDLINKVDLQRAAIILGYRIQGAIAQRKSMSFVLPATLRSRTSCVLIVSSELQHSDLGAVLKWRLWKMLVVSAHWLRLSCICLTFIYYYVM